MNWQDKIDKHHKGQTGFFKEIENKQKQEKMEYRIESVCKTTNDTLYVEYRKTKKSAFNLANRNLKKKEVVSVWITEYKDDADPTGAWRKYEDESNFKSHGGW